MQLYLRGLDADPVVETFHQGLMRCYQRLGRHAEAISAYRRMRQVLSVVLGVSPSEDSRSLYHAALEACPAAAAERPTIVPIRAGQDNRRGATPRGRKKG